MAVYCKSCGKRCIVLKSKSEVNPDRPYWSCPTQWVDGGHGWVEWVDGGRSPLKAPPTPRSVVRNLESSLMGQRSPTEELRQMSCDRMVEELVKELEKEKRKLEKEKMKVEKEKMKSTCLMKILSGVVFCFLCWIVFN